MGVRGIHSDHTRIRGTLPVMPSIFANLFWDFGDLTTDCVGIFSVFSFCG